MIKIKIARFILLPFLIGGNCFSYANHQINTSMLHVWEKVEITLLSEKKYSNAYTEVDVWVDLKGPENFNKRCYGFWDGDNIFRVRVMATTPGQWTWESGSNQNDAGLNGKTGSFNAVAWSDQELSENDNRRGMIRPTKNGRALEYADGTSFFLLGDTWWTAPTFRFKWYDDEIKRDIGPDAGFKDYVRFRKSQGYNSIAMLAALPNWAEDDFPKTIRIRGNLTVRDGWNNPRNPNSTKDMYNEGGRAFLFPGKVPDYEQVFPDMDRINPDYFKHMDKKIDYLNEQGFIPFIEIARRDISTCWKAFHDWPTSYSRYMQYIFSRYQANICIFSPIHFDSPSKSVPPKDYKVPIELAISKFGKPPFGTLLSTNPSMSSMVDFGNHNEAPWMDMHQIGNKREHEYYWYLTEIFYESSPSKPAFNGEPYYAGNFQFKGTAQELAGFQGTPLDDLFCRSGMYGSFLSGGFAGHIYGANGIWPGDIEKGSYPFMWEAFMWESGAQLQHLKTFAMSEGNKYQELNPNANLVLPNSNYNTRAYEGWAYAARTVDRKLFMVYFEKGCPSSIIRGTLSDHPYRATWFNTKTGEWIPMNENGILQSTKFQTIILPEKPSDDDWALKLVALD